MKKTLLSILFLCLFAVAGHSAVPYLLNEGFESGIPAGWSQQVMSNDSCLWIADTVMTHPDGAFEGTGRVAMRNTTGITMGYTTRLITPVLNLAAVPNPQLSFAYAQPNRSGYHDTLIVYYRLHEDFEWTVLVKYFDGQNQWKKEVVGLVGTYGQATAFQLAFEAKEDMGYGVLLDDVRIFPESQCANSVITGVIPMSNSAELLWQGDYGRLYEILVDSLPVDDPASYAQQALYYRSGVSAHSVSVTGLSELKDYYAYVRSDCDDNESGYTEWASLQFATSTAYPYLPDFSAGMPAGWANKSGALTGENLVANTGSYVWAYTESTAVIGAPHIYGRGNYYSNTPSWFVMPAVDMTLADADAVALSFDLALTSGANSTGSVSATYKSTCILHIMVTDNEGQTWSELESFNGEELSTSPQSINVDLSDYVGSVIRLAFVAEQGTSSAYFQVGNVAVNEYDIACAGIRKLLIETGDGTAALSWSVVGTNKNAVVVLSSTSAYADTLQAINVTTNAASFSGLAPLTTYYVSVRQDCEKEYILKGSFKTPCTTIRTFPWSENFNSLTSGIPECWDNEEGTTTTASYNWNYYSTGYDGNCLRFNSYMNSTGKTNVLALPTIGLPQEPMALSFYWKNPTGGAGEILIAVDGDTARTVLENQLTGISEWTEFEIDLSDYVGHAVNIYFSGTSNYGNGDAYLYLDDVAIKPLPTCLKMSPVSVAGVYTHGVSLDFKPNKSPAYQLVIAKSAISLVDFETDTNVVYTGIFQNIPIELTNSDALEANTRYYAYLRGYCGDEDQGEWSGAIQFKTRCEAVSVADFGVETFTNADALDCWSTGISTVGTGTNNAIARRLTTLSAFGPYLALNRTVTTATANDGPYAITPQIDFGNDSINHYQIVFSAATTQSYATNMAKLNVAVVSDPNDLSDIWVAKVIALPFASDSTGEQIFSVSFADYEGDAYGNYGNYIMFQAAEALEHDSTNYILIDNISIELASNCPQLIELSIDSITTTSAMMHWEEMSAPEFQVMVADINTREPDTIAEPQFIGSVSTNSALLSGLTASTVYFAYVRAICGAGDTAKWSNAISFKTALGAPFLEDFDSFANGYMSQGWMAYRGMASADSLYAENMSESSSTYGSYVQEKPSHISNMSGQAVRAEIYSSSYNSLLVSPTIFVGEAPEGLGWQLTFRAAAVPYSGTSALSDATDHFLKVMVSNDGGATFHKVASWEVGKGDFNFNAIKSNAILGKVDLSDYAGQQIKLGFFTGTESSSSPDTYFWIDSVAINAYNTACGGAKALAVALNGLSATATWQLTGAPAKSVIELSNMADFSMILDSAILENEFSREFTGLDYSTTYFVRVKQADCENAAWVTTSFATPLGVPYAESFNHAALPSTWKIMSGAPASAFAGSAPTSTSSGWVVSTSSNGLPANHARINIYSDTSNRWLLSPVINMEALEQGDNVEFSFDFAYTKYNAATAVTDTTVNQALFVLVSEDGGLTWNQTNSWEWAQKDTTAAVIYNLSDISNTGASITLDFSRFAGKNIQIAFVAVNISGDSDFHIANISLKKIVDDCLDPSGLVAEGGDNLVALSWSGDSTKVSVVELALSSEFTSGVIFDTVPAGQLIDTIRGLATATAYYARVRQICANGVTGYTAIQSAMTTCGVIATFPWSEGFEDMPVGSYSSDAPQCWEYMNLNTGSSTTYPQAYVNNTSTYVHSGVRSLYFKSSSSTYAYAILPQMDELDKLQIEFYYKNEGTSAYDGILSLGYFTDITKESSFVLLASFDRISSTWGHVEMELNDIPQSLASVARLAFRYGGGSSSNYFLGIDDIVISKVPNCKPVKNLAVVAEATQAAISYVDTLAAAYQVIVSTINYNVDSITPESLTPADSAAVVFATVTTENSVLATGLEPNTQYYAYVRGVCGLTEYSPFVKAAFKSDCNPIAAFPWSEDFESYASGSSTIGFSEDCWSNVHTVATGTGATYLYYVNTVTQGTNTTHKLCLPDMSSGNITVLSLPVMLLPDSNAYTFAIDVYRNATGTSYTTEGIRVYAAHGTQVDSSAIELGFLYRNCTQTDGKVVKAEDASGWYTYEFVIPMSGNVHILLQGESKYGSATYVDNFVVNKIPSCKDIKGLKAIATTTTSATLAFSQEGAPLYQIVVASDSINPEALDSIDPALIAYADTVSVDTLVINSLAPSTNYYAYVRAICDSVDASAWAELQFATRCLEAIPYVENFDDESSHKVFYSTYKIPSCWETDYSSTSNLAYLQKSGLASATSTSSYNYSNSGDYALRMYSTSSGWNYVVLPEMAVTLDSLQISFKARSMYNYVDINSGAETVTSYASSSYAHGVVVGTMSDPNDWSTFQLLDTYVTTEYATKPASLDNGTDNYWENATVYLQGGAGKYIALASYFNQTNYIWIDDIEVSYAPDCTAPNGITAVPGATTVDLAWAGSADEYRIALGQPGFNPDTVSAVYVTDSLYYTLDNLQPSTNYEIYIMSGCYAEGGIIYSPWSKGKSFTTLCLAPLGATYDFDGETQYTITSSYTMENCWNSIYESTSYMAQVKTNTNGTYPYTYAYSGDKALYLYTYSSSYKTAAVMPLIDADLDTLKVRFMGRAGYKYEGSTSTYISGAGSSYAGAVKVGTMTDPNDLTTFQLIKVCQGVTGLTSSDGIESDPMGMEYWRQFEVNLAGAAGPYIAFVSDFDQSNYFCIDNVEILRGDPCPEPMAPTVGEIDKHTALVMWDQAQSMMNDVALLQGADTISITRVIDANSLELENLAARTAYTVATRVVCDSTTVSKWSDPVTFYTACDVVSTFPWNEGFEDMPIGSATSEAPLCWDLRYANGQQQVTNQYIYVKADDNYIHSGSHCLYFKSNGNDGAFAILPQIDSLELMALSLYYSYEGANSGILSVGYMTDIDDTASFVMLASFPHDDAIKVPTLAKVLLNVIPAQVAAQARLAIRYKGGNAAWYAGVDDLSIDYLPSCFEISSISASAVTGHDATLTLNGTDAPAYELIVASMAIDPDSVENVPASLVVYHALVDSNVVDLSGLKSSTKYYAYVRCICGDDMVSAWTSGSFETQFEASFPFEESFGTSSLPTYWSRYTGLASNIFAGASLEASSSGWTNTTTLIDTYHPKLNIYGATCKSWLVSPAIPLPQMEEDEGIALSFDLALTAYGTTGEAGTDVDDDKFIVVISLDNGATWSQANATIWAGDSTADYSYASISNTPVNVTINLSQYAGQTIMIGFYGESTVWGSDNDLHIANVSVHSVNMNCPALESVKIVNPAISGTQVVVNYGEEGTQEVLIVLSKYDSPDADYAILVDTLRNDTVYTLPNLEVSSTYYVYVTRYCGDAGISSWSKASFKTPLGVRYAPIFSSTTLPSDWTRATGLVDNVMSGTAQLASTTSGWFLTAKDSIIGSTHFRGNIYGSSWNYWVVTPAIDLTPNMGEGLLLNFDAYLTAYSDAKKPNRNNGVDDRFVVVVSTDDGATWTKLAEWNNAGTGEYVYNDVPEGGQSYHLDMTRFGGQIVRIAFYGESTNENADNYFHFGNIVLDKCGGASVSYTAQVCEGEDYNGIEEGNPFYVASTDYVPGVNLYSIYQPATESGVDTMFVLNLMVNVPSIYSYPVALCEGEHYSDENFADFVAVMGMNKPRRVLTSASGCDSVIILDLTVNPNQTVHINDSVARGQAYTWHGVDYYTAQNIAFDTVSAVTGCDSITVLHLTVYVPTGMDNVYAEKLMLTPNPVEVGQPVQVLNDFSAAELADAKIEVFSASGMLLYSAHGAAQPLIIPAMSVSGLHYVRITVADKVYNSPLLVK